MGPLVYIIGFVFHNDILNVLHATNAINFFICDRRGITPVTMGPLHKKLFYGGNHGIACLCNKCNISF